MKKQFKRRIHGKYSKAYEDLAILQRMITKRSVYATIKNEYSRRPKHRQQYLEYIET